MRYIRFKELKTLVPLGRTTIWRMERDGQFPQSRRIGKTAKAWLEAEVLSWMQGRASLANEPSGKRREEKRH